MVIIITLSNRRKKSCPMRYFNFFSQKYQEADVMVIVIGNGHADMS